MSGILGNFITKLAEDNAGGAFRALETAGKAAIIAAAGPFGPVAGGLLGLLEKSVALGELSAEEVAAIRSSHDEGITAKIKEMFLGKPEPTAKQKAKWNRDRQSAWWQANQARYDWRTQPRRPAGTEAGGEWMPGRLDAPVQVKFKVSRRERQRRTKAIKAYKARQIAMGIPKSSLRVIRTSWGDF